MKFIREISDNGLRPLTEANLNRVSKGHEKDGYAIISVSRSEFSNDENNARTNKLKQYLRDKGYSYLSVYGGYKELGQDKASLEKSFVVYPYDIKSKTQIDFNTFLDDMKDICGPKFGDQDSILVCEPGGKPKYIALKDGVDEMSFDGVKYNDTDSEFFTAIKKWSDSSLNNKKRNWDNGKPQRYTLECYIDNPPHTVGLGHTRFAMGDINHIYGE